MSAQKWKDGTPRSQGNAFDWRNHATGFDIAAFRKPASSKPANKGGFGVDEGRIYGLSSKADKLLAAKPALKKHISGAQPMRHNGAYSKAGPALTKPKGNNLNNGKFIEPTIGRKGKK